MAAPLSLRKWQEKALSLWKDGGNRGILEVVTGGGKTIFALAAIRAIKAETTLIVVPTEALLEQWWVEAANFFGMSLDEVNIINSKSRLRLGSVNIGVINSASSLVRDRQPEEHFLIVDECHKAASEQFSAVLGGKPIATLGLSATPERQYDDGLNDILIPALGPVIYRYTYADALADGVIVPFKLVNVLFEMEEDRQAEYDKLTGAIARSINKRGFEDDQTLSLLLKRTRLANLSLKRIRLALSLVARHRGSRILVFHEDIDAYALIHEALASNGVRSGIYHSRISGRVRAETLKEFRSGNVEVLVTCRALDEGFNVPEAQIGIIAASTATRRQRIQRLGRILRPSGSKESATVYSIVATGPEVNRLREEEEELQGVAETVWRGG